MKKIAVYLNHPSHYYIFKNVIKTLSKPNTEFMFFCKHKDILEDLLVKDLCEYISIPNSRIKKRFSIPGLIVNTCLKNNALLNKLKDFEPDMLISCASDVAQVGFLLRIPSFVLNDDDAKVVPFSACFGWPFATNIFAPLSCNMGYWRKKTIFYNGFQKLAYLHPNYFQPDKKVIRRYGLMDETYFLIRSVSLTAHHDKNIRGLNNELVEKLIKILSPHGRVFISSEKELPPNLNIYKLHINPLDIHHVIYFSALLVGDSQSMAHEAALLGTPSVRYNDFVGRIGVMEELEHKYHLTFGISPDKPGVFLDKVKELAVLKEKSAFKEKAQKMIEKMIDLPSFVAWFIENYPESNSLIAEKRPEFWNQFK
jgi:uncharacterized protein